jgi:hypothetical protein
MSAMGRPQRSISAGRVAAFGALPGVSANARLTQRGRSGAESKLPPLRHSAERGMAADRPHRGRQEAEADGAADLAAIDPVDQRRELLTPPVVGFE